MTNLIFFKKSDNFVGFSCKGHAGYSDIGTDIVCASISTAVEICIAYLDKFHNDKISFEVDEHSSCITLHCTEQFQEADKQISVLADFAKSLQEQYPKYFTFNFLEV